MIDLEVPMELARMMLYHMEDFGKPWLSATLYMTVEDTMTTHTGTYVDHSHKVHPLPNDLWLRPGLATEVIEWRKEMIANRTGHWNKLELIVQPDNKSEIFFTWDQSVQDERDRIEAKVAAERAAEAGK